MNPKYKNIFIYTGIFLALLGAWLAFYFTSQNRAEQARQLFDSSPQGVIFSGMYVCLPHSETKDPQTEECAFGVKLGNDYYAVNFGASSDAMGDFQSGKSVTAEGFVVMKEALDTGQWSRYNMKGLFTITKIVTPTKQPVPSAKLDITVVCNHALTYMTFPTALMAEAFVNECKEGKHPEVIERYKVDMKLDVGAAI